MQARFRGRAVEPFANPKPYLRRSPSDRSGRHADDGARLNSDPRALQNVR